MLEQYTYLSPEWAAESQKRIIAELTPEKMNDLTTSMSNIFRNCPDKKERYFFISAEKGVVTKVEVGEGEAPKAEFVIAGDYEIFAQISRAEMGSQFALMTGKLKVRGNLAKALKLAAVADRVTRVLSQIPTKY